MKQLNGWHLPGKDSYFTRFVEGAPPKRNGFQREHLQLAFEHVKAWDIAIDVGAHVGFWTVDMAERFGQVFAFEPARDTFECLIKNTAEFPNVTCCNAAIGPKSGKCRIEEDSKYERQGNTGARFVVPGKGETEMIALDELIFAGCDFLKIDVEGYEPGVLAGASTLIRAYKPVVIMEIDKRFEDRFAFSKGQAQVDMLEMGYQEVVYPGLHKGKVVNAIRPDRIFVPDV